MLYATPVLILYIVLVLSTLAVVGAVWICYRHVQRHLQATRLQRPVSIATRTDAEPHQGHS